MLFCSSSIVLDNVICLFFPFFFFQIVCEVFEDFYFSFCVILKKFPF